MQKLKTPSLFREQAYIAGKWVDAESKEKITVTNPADATLVGTVPSCSRDEVKKAVKHSALVAPAWAATTAKERANILRRFFDLMIEHKDDLAVIMTTEQGKPLAEAKGEVEYAASFLEWFGEEAKRIYGDVIPAPKAGQKIVVLKQPVGVCAAITPWNFPASMITRKIAPALAAGCTILLKPASETPFSALAMAVLAEKAGVPAGVFNVLTGNAAAIGKEFCENPLIRKLSFTGSTEVGKILMAQSAGTLKRLSFELGGNAPFIVFDDATIEAAINGAMASKYRNSGQTCICANRIFVQDGVFDVFTKRLVEKTKQLKTGDGFEEGVVQGPLINGAAITKAEKLLADAVQKGATVVTGGKRMPGRGYFFEPTVVTGITPKMDISHEEIFAPIAAITRFSSEEEVISMANDTPYGLASYFYSNNLQRVWRVAEALQYGMVGINEGLISTEVAPFGGVKESGFGREGSYMGIEEYVDVKYLCMGNL